MDMWSWPTLMAAILTLLVALAIGSWLGRRFDRPKPSTERGERPEAPRGHRTPPGWERAA